MICMFFIVVLVVLLLFVLVVCGGKVFVIVGDVGVVGMLEVNMVLLDVQQQLIVKFNVYIGCFNVFDLKMYDSFQFYMCWIKDVEVGLSGCEIQVYGLFEISDYDMKQCDGLVIEVMVVKLVLVEFDVVVSYYQQVLKVLVLVSKEVYDYYDCQDYEDDQFVKGKQLYVFLLVVFKDFVVVSEMFNVELECQNDVVQCEQFKVLEQVEG